MEIQISWTANWAGNHDVCYRKVGELAWTCVTVNSVLGTNSTIINVPTNYCDEVEYEGYIIAECSSGQDTNEDGFPDFSTQFNLFINTTTDTCEPYEITCDTVPIDSITIDVPGSNYAVSEQILANGVDVVGEISVIGGGGEIVDYNLFPGFAYATPPALTINTVSGVGGSLTAVLGACQMTLSGCAGTNDDGAGLDPEGKLVIDVAVGDSITVCSDTVPDPLVPAPATTTVTSQLVPLGNTCNCLTCVELTVDNPTAGDLEIHYTTCNNEFGNQVIVLWKEVIEAGQTNYSPADCVIQESVYAEAGLNITFTACPVPL